MDITAIPAPAERPNLDDYPRDERSRYYRDLDAWWASTVGLELLSRVDDRLDERLDATTLVQFCSECCAGGSPLGEPVRGLDSHRECASDGGTVWWARLVEQPTDPTTDTASGEGAEPPAESVEQSAPAAEAWPPHRWVRLPEGALDRLVERESDLLEMQSLLRRSRDSEIDRYFSRLIGGQLAAVDTALELVESLKEQAADVAECAGWLHLSTAHLEMCGNCGQPRGAHDDA